MTVLEIVKTLLKIEGDEQDELLELYIKIVTQQILNYCNISELPEALKFVAAQMVVEMVSEQSIGSDLANTPVASVSEAGRTVSFATAQIITQAAEQRIKDRKTQLDRFKQLYAFR